jgi:hypothetical protein
MYLSGAVHARKEGRFASVAALVSISALGETSRPANVIRIFSIVIHSNQFHKSPNSILPTKRGLNAKNIISKQPKFVKPGFKIRSFKSSLYNNVFYIILTSYIFHSYFNFKSSERLCGGHENNAYQEFFFL